MCIYCNDIDRPPHTVSHQTILVHRRNWYLRQRIPQPGGAAYNANDVDGSPAIQKLYTMSIQATILMIRTIHTGPKTTILTEVGLHSTLLESTKLIIE